MVILECRLIKYIDVAFSRKDSHFMNLSRRNLGHAKVNQRIPGPAGHFVQAFQMLDKDGTGFVDMAEPGNQRAVDGNGATTFHVVTPCHTPKKKRDADRFCVLHGSFPTWMKQPDVTSRFCIA